MRLQLIRNATLVLEYAGKRILIDPDLAPKYSRRSFTGKSPNPVVDLPMPLEQIVDGLDAVLVSHLHADHFDRVEALPKAIPVFCQPGNEEAIRSKGFGQVTPVQDRLEWASLTLIRTPGEHGSGRVLELMGKVSGFVLQAPGEPSVYWAGDTILYGAVGQTIAAYQPQVIITHSGGAQWGEGGLIIMDAAQTVEVCQLAPLSVVVATHLEALDHCTTARAELRAYADARGIPAQSLLIPADGEVITLYE